MSTRVFESGGQRIDVDGSIGEIAFKGGVKDNLLKQAKEGYYSGDGSAMLLEKNDTSMMMERMVVSRAKCNTLSNLDGSV